MKAFTTSGILGTRTKAMPAREANDPTPVSLYDTEERLVAGTICERTLIEGGCSTSCSCVVRANLPLIEVLEQTGEIRFFRKDTGIGPTKISGLFPLTLEKGKFSAVTLVILIQTPILHLISQMRMHDTVKAYRKILQIFISMSVAWGDANCRFADQADSRVFYF